MISKLNYFSSKSSEEFSISSSMQERIHWGFRGAMPRSSVSKPNKVHKFQFQASGILLFTNVQKLHGPKISQYLLCMPHLNNLWGLLIFANYIGKSLHVGPSEKVQYLTVDLLKRFFSWTIGKKTTMNESLNLRL